MVLFLSIFTVVTKGDSKIIYTFSGADMKVKGQFKGSFSNVQDLKMNFIMVKKSFLVNAVKSKIFKPWGFTIH